ncbi:MAG TPA: hypothetical protein VGC53_10320 [Vicinamibacteria bacterium]
MRAHFDNAHEKMGTAESFVSYGPQWAEASSAPFSRYKGYTREGGIVAPLIITGRGVAAQGAIDSTYLTVMDLAPTFLEMAGVEYPRDGSVAPMLGESIKALLEGAADAVHADSYSRKARRIVLARQPSVTPSTRRPVTHRNKAYGKPVDFLDHVIQRPAKSGTFGGRPIGNGTCPKLSLASMASDGVAESHGGP